MRKFLTVAILVLIAACLGLALFNSGDPEIYSSAKLADDLNGRSVFMEASLVSSAQPSANVRTEVSPTGDGESQVFSSVAAFNYYVATLRRLPTAEDRERELAVYARALRKFEVAPLQQLGVLELDNVNYEFEVGTMGKMQNPLVHALLELWFDNAVKSGEDLTPDVIRVWQETAFPFLHQADTGMLEFSAIALGYLESAEQIRSYIPSILDAFRSIPEGVKIEQKRYQPPLRLLARACKKNAWIRPQALALLSEPWMQDSSKMSFLAIMVVGTGYAEWATALSELLASPDSTKQWAAVEALRYFASKKDLDPARLSLLVPDAFFSSPDGALRMASIELLAEYGETVGQQRLVALLYDESYAFRGQVLNFLAFSGKAPLNVCFEFLVGNDKKLRATALFSLGHMAKTSNEAFKRLCLEAKQNADPSIRAGAIQGLGRSERDILAVLKVALEDPAKEVQLAAVEELGHSPNGLEVLDALLAEGKSPREVRELGYRKVLLETPLSNVPSVVDRMLEDTDEQIAGGGYLLKAALAVGSGDQEAMADWQALEIPNWVLQQEGIVNGSSMADLVRTLGSTGIKKQIANEVQTRIEALMDPRYQRKLDEHDRFLRMGAVGGSRLLDGMFAEQKLMLRFLRQHQNE